MKEDKLMMADEELDHVVGGSKAYQYYAVTGADNKLVYKFVSTKRTTTRTAEGIHIEGESSTATVSAAKLDKFLAILAKHGDTATLVDAPKE